jgi:hypothetical protein
MDPDHELFPRFILLVMVHDDAVHGDHVAVLCTVIGDDGQVIAGGEAIPFRAASGKRRTLSACRGPPFTAM